MAVESSPLTNELERFDIAQMVRGINSLKAAQLLMENSHWEFASGVARQLYEHLVNLEFLSRQPDRTQAVRSYAMFGLMQAIRQQIAELDYASGTGRPVDTAHRQRLEGWIGANFEEFKGKPKADGSVNFKSTWTGKPVSQLAADSQNRMRVAQYELIYREWSTEVHAAPAALIESLLRAPGMALGDILEEEVDKVAQMMAVTLNLFVDLWHVLPHVEQPTLAGKLTWLQRINTELARVVDLTDYSPPLSGS